MSRLANIIDVDTFNELPAQDIPEKTALFESGVVVRNELLDTIANAPGKTAEMVFWGDLDPTVEQNYSNDNPADEATPLQISQLDMTARKAFINQGWTESDLAAELAMGGNAMRRIRARLDSYWMRRWQRRIVKTAVGVMLANISQDGGDMVKDISIEDGNAATDANKIDRSSVLAAAFTMGDQWEQIRAMGVHSVVMQRLLENDDIIFQPDSEGKFTIPTYLGRRIFTDDGVPVLAGTTSGYRYVTMLFGAAAFAYGEGTPEVPTEVSRKAEGGNGGGVETLWSRKTWLVHPAGHDFTSNTVTGPASPKNPNNISPTDSNLALAANWDRKYARKNIPLAYLVTNG